MRSWVITTKLNYLEVTITPTKFLQIDYWKLTTMDSILFKIELKINIAHISQFCVSSIIKV